jgi:hypothetical protein
MSSIVFVTGYKELAFFLRVKNFLVLEKKGEEKENFRALGRTIGWFKFKGQA